jgi:hypothetical protein
MEDSSIFDDLRKHAGPITGIRVATEKPKVAATIIKNVKPVKPVKATPKPVESTIDEIAKHVKHPMMVLRDVNGIIHDDATIAVKCEFAHIHRYFLRDVILIPIKCITCDTGPKFAKTVREYVEAVLGVPFIVTSEKKTYPILFSNPTIKITIACLKDSGQDSSDFNDDTKVVTFNMHNTASANKIKHSLHSFLTIIQDAFDDDTKARIASLQVEKAKKAKPTEYKKNKLPFTPELAATHGNVEVLNDPKLCLENCK